MNIPKNPQEKFQYYFDIANGLDEIYEDKINKVNSQRFRFKPRQTYAYKVNAINNAEEARNLKEEYTGAYSEYSAGYDNSMQKVARENVETLEKEKNDAFADSLYQAEKQNWMEEKTKKIASLKNMYARRFGDAVYKMQKANEEMAY